MPPDTVHSGAQAASARPLLAAPPVVAQTRSGWLRRVTLGYGGAGDYGRIQFGLHVTLEGHGWQGDADGRWAVNSSHVLPPAAEQLDAGARGKLCGKLVQRLMTHLADAGVDLIHQLVDKPVRVDFDSDGLLVDWQIDRERLATQTAGDGSTPWT